MPPRDTETRTLAQGVLAHLAVAFLRMRTYQAVHGKVTCTSMPIRTTGLSVTVRQVCVKSSPLMHDVVMLMTYG